jgi:tetratricopeptide (TPR) repeat protein
LIGEVFALNDLGAIAGSHGDMDALLRYLQQSLNVAKRIGSRLWMARILVALAATYRDQAKREQTTGERRQATGDLDRAMRLFDDALLIFQDLGDRRSEAMLLLERPDALLLLEAVRWASPASRCPPERVNPTRRPWRGSPKSAKAPASCRANPVRAGSMLDRLSLRNHRPAVSVGHLEESVSTARAPTTEAGAPRRNRATSSRQPAGVSPAQGDARSSV